MVCGDVPAIAPDQLTGTVEVPGSPASTVLGARG